MFFNIESGEYITIGQLYIEYTENKKNFPDEYNYTFIEYVSICLTENNGTLEVVQNK